MEYLYAVLLLHEAGKEINEENIKKVLESVGIQVNEALLNAVLSSLEGVDLNKIKEETLLTPTTVQPATTEGKKEEKKEEKPKEEEKKEEQALEGLQSLFGF